MKTRKPPQFRIDLLILPDNQGLFYVCDEFPDLSKQIPIDADEGPLWHQAQVEFEQELALAAKAAATASHGHV